MLESQDQDAQVRLLVMLILFVLFILLVLVIMLELLILLVLLREGVRNSKLYRGYSSFLCSQVYLDIYLIGYLARYTWLYSHATLALYTQRNLALRWKGAKNHPF